LGIIFFLSVQTRPTLSHIQWVKGSERNANHPRSSTVNIKEEESYTPTSPYVVMAGAQTEIFTGVGGYIYV